MNSTRIAVVTGSNKGIGFAVVKGLCKEFAGGDGIVYLTSRDVQRGEKAVKELEKLGLHPKFHQLDVNDQNSIYRFRDHLKKSHGGLDILVNNAAIAFKNDATEPFSIQAEETVSVNYFSLLRVCRTLFPLLRDNARVVNVSSSAGHLSRIPGAELRRQLSHKELTEVELSALMTKFINSAKVDKNVEDGWGNSAYVVSKVGVTALTIIQQRNFDGNSGKKGLNINAVHPGYVDTDMTSHKGNLTIDQGAEAPLHLALLPVNDPTKGCFVWFNKEIVNWFGNSTPSKV